MRITVCRQIDELTQLQWEFDLFDSKLRCVSFARLARSMKHHQYTLESTWNLHVRDARALATDVPFPEDVGAEALQRLRESLTVVGPGV